MRFLFPNNQPFRYNDSKRKQIGAKFSMVVAVVAVVVVAVVVVVEVIVVMMVVA